MTIPAQQVVLVTGASSGIGKATAERLLADGHTVYVAARCVDRMRDLETRGATALKMDITREDEVTAVIARALRVLGPRTRYAAGSLARPLLALRWLLPDRAFVRLIRSQF
ncbi:MAG: SDR family NAD(P)-dependent oxidoreductase [Bacteroidetes bacterium]|nr:MAG: SDR family NAD(P)-dependent oxidoreductase [Bacteroidota bacterium]